MKKFLLMQWAPRSLRIPVWCLILGLCFGGPIGLIAGLAVAILVFPFCFIYSVMCEAYDQSMTTTAWVGSKPSDNLRMSEMIKN